MTEDLNSSVAEDSWQNRSKKTSPCGASPEGDVLCIPMTGCPNSGEREDFYLTESITYRASFDDGVFNVYGNKDNSIDWIRCNACEREFTMREIELTRVNFN